MKVLIYVPLAPMTPRIYARSMTSILSMQWQEPCEIVFGRNDMDKWPSHNQGYLDVTEKYNRAREMTLSGGYDALMTIESDMIIPKLALERLSRVEADVAYGLYVSRHGKLQWLAFDKITDKPYYGSSLSDDPINSREAWGQVVETVGVGMGCTFIHRHVLEKIEFRCPDPAVANDWFFSLDCQANGFVQKHDCGVVCGHIQGGPDPKILWPSEDGKYRVEFFGEPEPIKVTDSYSVNVNGSTPTMIFGVQP